MKVANLTDVKDELSSYVERARRGESVRIMVRGVPAADLVPIGVARSGREAEASWPDEELAQLERLGVIRRGAKAGPGVLDRPGPRLKKGDAVAALIAERRGGW